MKRKFKPHTPIQESIKELLKDPEVRMLYEERQAKEKRRIF